MAMETIEEKIKVVVLAVGQTFEVWSEWRQQWFHKTVKAESDNVVIGRFMEKGYIRNISKID